MSFKITQVSTKRCPPCQMAKERLTELAKDSRFTYEYLDFFEDRDEIKDRGLRLYQRSVPMFFDSDGEPLKLMYTEVIHLVKQKLSQ